MTRSKSTAVVLAALAILVAGGPVMAQDMAPARTLSPTVQPPEAHQAPAALTTAEMAAVSGGEAVRIEVLTRQQLTGATSGNTINAGTVTSGAVNFSESALSGFNGVGNFVVNTGANNTLQGAINISIVTAPPGP